MTGGAAASQAYGEAWYWDERYRKEAGPFDWYQKYPSLAPLLRLYLAPHHRLLLSALSALSLAKLRRFPDAAVLLASLHPDPACPPPPFLIRLLHALLPLFLPDRPLALDRLYTLLSSVRARMTSAAAQTRLRRVWYASHRVRRESTRGYASTRQKNFGRACPGNTVYNILTSWGYIIIV